MLRVLGQLSIYGTKASIDRFAAVAPIPSAKITQVGLKRKVPEVDSWCYASPWYRFRIEAIDDEVRNFLLNHRQVGTGLASRDPDLRYAFFTLCPVGQSDDETFGCLFGHETLQALSGLGVSFQIAPESLMPEAAFWVAEK